MRDPTFHGACRLQLQEFREGEGCNMCKHRDKNTRAFGLHLCGIGEGPQSMDKIYCWKWKLDEDLRHPRAIK